MGIDKKSREAGGQQTVASYVAFAKRTAHEYGVHISKRTLAYEKFCMELRMKLRVLANADDEDKLYEGVSESSVLEFCADELVRLEEVDKKFAAEKGKLFVGRL